MHQHVRTSGPAEHWIAQLAEFAGPPELYLRELIASQCAIAGAEQGAILRRSVQGPEILAVWPETESHSMHSVWLAQASELMSQVLGSEQSRMVPVRRPDEMYGVRPSQHLLLIPLRGGSGVRGISALLLTTCDADVVDQARQRVEPTAAFLALYEMRLTLQKRGTDLRRLKQACEMLCHQNEQHRYQAAAMGLCNQLAAAWSAERVSLGWVKGRYVKLAAMSHTEKFTRKMELVQAIESVMEECVDQDQEVITPAGEASTIVNRAAGELATKHGPTTVLSLPLRDREQVVGAITIERAVDQPFALDEIETLRLTCDLSTARLVDLEQHDRWFGARAARAIHRGAGVVIGPTHTWAKLAALATAAVIAFAVFTKGTYRVESPFVVEAIQQQVVAAPFDGYLLEALVSNGDRVEAGKTILARLDTAQLQLERAKAEAERRGYIKKSQISRRENKIGEEQVAQADADRLKAQIDLLTWQIDRAVIVAPIDGVIVSGDLDKKIGGPVQVGQTLFEIAPIESLRARLSVPEDDVPDVQLQQIGQLAAVSHPGDYLPIIVERIDPVAQVVDQHNVFSVRASLRDQPQWLRPGMEGVARLDVEQRRYVSIWTRSLVNWIRMKLWL